MADPGYVFRDVLLPSVEQGIGVATDKSLKDSKNSRMTLS